MGSKVTAGVITLNEERNIERCLRSLSWCDQILVVDSGSTDQTCAKAQQLGARVIHRDWTGFADQRNFLLQQAEHDWVLFLDADESLPRESHSEVRRLLEENVHTAWSFKRKSFYLGRWILHGGWHPDWQTRLLHKKQNIYANNLIHEHVVSQGTVGKSNITIEHYPFISIADHVDTNNRYSSLYAQDILQKKIYFSIFKLITKPWVKFIECYFLKAGFKDGIPGIIIAISAAYSVFLKWSKLWEQQKFKR